MWCKNQLFLLSANSKSSLQKTHTNKEKDASYRTHSTVDSIPFTRLDSIHSAVYFQIKRTGAVKWKFSKFKKQKSKGYQNAIQQPIPPQDLRIGECLLCMQITSYNWIEHKPTSYFVVFTPLHCLFSKSQYKITFGFEKLRCNWFPVCNLMLVEVRRCA